MLRFCRYLSHWFKIITHAVASFKLVNSAGQQRSAGALRKKMKNLQRTGWGITI